MGRGFRGLTEVRALTDDQARTLVLGNWHKLNTVLRTRLSVTDLRRLLVLELTHEAGPREEIAERLRAALSRAMGRDSATALLELLNETHTNSGRVERMIRMGLTQEDAVAVLSRYSPVSANGDGK